MEWNDYSYGIVNPLFGRDIFLGIVISLGIVIPMGMTNLIHTGITIPLKNEWNSYSLWNGMDFSQKKPFIIFYFFILFSYIFSPSKQCLSSPIQPCFCSLSLFSLSQRDRPSPAKVFVSGHHVEAPPSWRIVHLRLVEAKIPSKDRTPVVSHHEHLVLVGGYGVQERNEITHHVEARVAGGLNRRVRVAVAAEVESHGSVAERGQGYDLVPPRVPELRETMQEENHWALTFLRGWCDHPQVMQRVVGLPMWLPATVIFFFFLKNGGVFGNFCLTALRIHTLLPN
jgi:hypothetical protein